MTRCLIVDDSPYFRAAAQAILESDGLEVVGTASTGAEALSLMRTLDPEVVLLDVDLGAENGFDIAGRLHEDPALRHLIVVMVSTRSVEEYADRLSVSPVAGFLAKEDLSRAALEELVGRS